MAGGLLAMMRGGVFLYYGQEIGMVGSGADPNKRIGMLWTAPEETTLPPPGADKTEYVWPSAEEQAADPASLLNYYRAALALRCRFPAIARGNSILRSGDSGSGDFCLIERSWEDETVLIALNPSRNECRVPLGELAPEYVRLSASLCAWEAEAALKDGVLDLPHYSIAILEKNG